jgi:hypothetical protein
MPLQDHFHPPLSLRRHWHSFHHAWATYISSDLNRLLPEGYFAEPNVQFGIEIDVAAFDEETNGHLGSSGWTPPAPVMTVPFAMATDTVEVQVFSGEGGPTLAGALELVSPTNKDRRSNRNAFVTKCASYLQQGLGLVVVDVVTERQGNLHDELINRLATEPRAAWGPDLYAVAYHPVKPADLPQLEIWRDVLSVGYPLPSLPLCLRGDLCIPVDLEASYMRTCQEQRLAVH